jgi:hypothetical protein
MLPRSLVVGDRTLAAPSEVQTGIDNTMIQRCLQVTRKEYGFRKWLRPCAPNGITG